jgi:hypothetical protein
MVDYGPRGPAGFSRLDRLELPPPCRVPGAKRSRWSSWKGALTRRQVVEVDLVDQLRVLLDDVAVVAMVAERALCDPDDVDAPWHVARNTV